MQTSVIYITQTVCENDN